MTVEAQRANHEAVAEMQAALALPVMQTALVLLETENPFSDVDDPRSPEVVSVRALSYGAGWHACLTTLRSLAVSTHPAPEFAEPTYPPPEPITQ